MVMMVLDIGVSDCRIYKTVHVTSDEPNNVHDGMMLLLSAMIS